MSTLPHSTGQQELIAQQAFLRRLALSLVVDEHRAEDLAQEAALEALLTGPQRLGAMRSWLRRVMQNLATDAARRERLRTAREGEATPPAAPLAPDEVAQRLQAQRRVLEALERLQEPYQSTLFLRFWDDLTPSEIARRTGVPVATVKTRLARGLARLRAELDEQHGGERSAWAVALVGGLRGTKGIELGTTAAALGGLAMGLKLVLAAAVIGAAAIGAWWWVSGDGVEPLRTQVARAEPTVIEAINDQGPTLPVPDAGARTAVPVSSLPTPGATEPSNPTTVLELELRGWRQGDTGPLALTIGSVRTESKTGPRGQPIPDASVRAELELADRLEIDVTTLFSDAGAVPTRLYITLDHRDYVPAEAWVLIPSEPADPLRITGVADLEHASTILTGRVDVPPGIPRDSVRVALHTFGLDDRPETKRPLDTASCDPEGRYRLRADDAPQHALVAWCAGLDDSQRSSLRPATRHLMLDGQDAVELDPLVIGRGARLRGRVVYAGGGSPAKGNVSVSPGERLFGNGKELVWIDESFEWGFHQVAIEETGNFEIEGLPDGECTVMFLGDEPQGAYAVAAKSSAEEATAPDDSFVLMVHRLSVTVRVECMGRPVPNAWLMVGASNREFFGVAADETGHCVLWLDPRKGLELELDEDPAYEPGQLVVLPEELTPGVIVKFELQPAKDSSLATLVLQPTGPGRDDLRQTLVDVVVYRFDEHGEIPESAREQMPKSFDLPMAIVRYHPDIALTREPDGSLVMSEFPPGKYFVRAIPRGNSVPRSFVTPQDFEVELGRGQRETRVWETTIGGRLRLNVIGRAQQMRGELRTAAGDLVPGFWLDAPGVREAVQALEPGSYQLQIRLAGVTRTFPIQIEAGRINDVEIDLETP